MSYGDLTETFPVSYLESLRYKRVLISIHLKYLKLQKNFIFFHSAAKCETVLIHVKPETYHVLFSSSFFALL